MSKEERDGMEDGVGADPGGEASPRRADGETDTRILELLKQRATVSRSGKLSHEELVTQLEVHRVELEMQNHELRETQVNLERTRRRYFTLFDISPVGYFVLDHLGRIVELNLVAADQVGIERGRLLGQNLFQHVCVERLSALEQFLREVFGDPQQHRVEVQFRRTEGPVIHVQMEGLQLPGVDGQDTYCLLVSTDVTERKLAEEERLRIERQLLEGQRLESIGLLAGGVAHDFNNLLTGVIGNLSLVVDSLPAGAPEAAILNQASACATRAADLCQQLLAYAGRARFVVQPVDINALCAETLKLLKSGFDARLEIRTEFNPTLPRVAADQTQIGQVVLNFLLNAGEAMSDRPGSIILRTGVTRIAEGGLEAAYPSPSLPAGGYLFVEVEDSGCGMTDEVSRRIFEPFFTTKFTGRGLGLAASLGIARAHRGAITASSIQGVGSTFRLLLPLSVAPVSSAPAAPVADRPPEAVGGSGTVLVVDDEELVRSVAIRSLQRLGYASASAESGEEALRLFTEARGEFAFVLLDLTMPHMNGTQVLHAMRDVRPETPVVIMSGFCEEDVLRRLQGQQPSAFLQKPFTSESLGHVLRLTGIVPGESGAPS